MYRSNTCGELRLSDAGKEVTLPDGYSAQEKWVV